MIEITKNLFIGNQDDYEREVRYNNNWFIIHACKEPYHRQALQYTGRAAPKTHPEYLIAKRENRLILNLVDVDNVAYIPAEIINAAISEIERNIEEMKVLVHCNQGQSRSATIGLLYLAHIGIITNNSFIEAEQEYRGLYPQYSPANGMREFANLNWNNYLKH